MSVTATVVVPAAAALLTFAISLDLPPQGLRRALLHPRALVVGLSAHLVVLPLLALALGTWLGDPLVLMAMLLVAVVPSGPASNYAAAIGRGDVPLALMMSIVGTPLCVLTLPVLLPLLVQVADPGISGLSPPVAELVKSLLVIIVLPLAAGLFVAQRFPATVQRVRPAVDRAAGAVFLLLVAGAIAAEWRTLSETFSRGFLWMAVLNVAATAAGWAIARAFALPRPQRVVVSIKCSFQNVAIAIVIAISQMDRLDIAATAALYAVFELASAGALALWWRRGSMQAALQP